MNQIIPVMVHHETEKKHRQPKKESGIFKILITQAKNNEKIVLLEVELN